MGGVPATRRKYQLFVASFNYLVMWFYNGVPFRTKLWECENETMGVRERNYGSARTKLWECENETMGVRERNYGRVRTKLWECENETMGE